MPTDLVVEFPHKLPCVDVQGSRQEDDIDQSNIALSTFDRANVRAMQARMMRERLLR